MLSRTSHDQRSHVELITVYEICRILCASLDIDRTFRAALNVLTAHMDLPRAMIVMNDADDSTLRVHSSVGLSREQEAARPLAARRGHHRPRGVLGHAGGGARRGAGQRVHRPHRRLQCAGRADDGLRRGAAEDRQVGGGRAGRAARGARRRTPVRRPAHPDHGGLAARAGGAAARRGARRAPAPAARGHAAAEGAQARAARPLCAGQRGRRVPADAAGVRRGAPGRALARHRAAARRERHRQGGDRARHPLPQPAQGRRRSSR